MEREIKKRVAVIGAGHIGKLVTRLLHKKYEVIVYDAMYSRARDAAGSGVQYGELNVNDKTQLKSVLWDKEIVVSCCPYFCNERIALAAAETNTSYCDLSEDVSSGKAIERIAFEKVTKSFIPHCGLAPGATQIIASDMVENSLHDVVSVTIRVGALPINPTNALKYNLTWSTNGLINECGNLCEAIIDGRLQELQPLEGYERLNIGDVEYEAFNTSGGLGTLARSLEGKVKRLTYKTLRYPGHRDLMKFLMMDLQLNERRHILEDILEYAIPTTEEDRVVMFISVISKDEGSLRQNTYGKLINHAYISGTHWTAIQIATASSMAAVVDLCLQGKIKEGFVRQEEISFDDFINNEFGRVYKYGEI